MFQSMPFFVYFYINIFYMKCKKKCECMLIKQPDRKKAGLYPALLSSFLYFIRVASPPRMCLSALFSSRILRTCFAMDGFSFLSLSVTSLCTVLLLIPNIWAAALTVVLFSIMNAPSSSALSSIYCFKADSLLQHQNLPGLRCFC